MKKNPYDDEKFQADMARAFQADVEREAQKHKRESGDLSEEEQMEILEYEKDEGTTIVSDKSKWDQELVRAYKDYEQVHVPNKEELAELVKKAKGDDRSMAEFSRICGEQGPSTFSRIVNGKIEKPVSTGLLVAIAKHAADPSEVTLDQLLRANGKIPKDEVMKKDEPLDLKAISLAYGIPRIRDMLIDYYLKQGKSVTIEPPKNLPTSKYALELPSDFIFQVRGSVPLYWNFMVDEDFDLPGGMDSEALKKAMQRYSPLFLRDAWDPKSLKDVRNIIVFAGKFRFDAFVNFFHGVKIKTKITAMCVDLPRKCIVEEKKL
jgi:hypothetical protein